MALSFYTSSARDFANGVVVWLTGTYKLAIMTNTYAFAATHDFFNDITNEVTGTNYTAAGMTLANKTLSAATVNPALMSADDVVIAQSAGGFANGRKYVTYKVVGSAATDPLLSYGTAGADFGNTAGQLTLDVPTNFMQVQV